jgi:hypothetical protein
MAAPKLSEEAREVVIQAIIEGRKNTEINQRLAAGGFEEITDGSLTHYRALPDVKAALAEREEAVKQIGLARFSERVERLDRHVRALEQRLYLDADGERLAPGDAMVVMTVSREWRATLKDISDLVDPAKQAKLDITSGGKELAAVGYEVVQPKED